MGTKTFICCHDCKFGADRESGSIIQSRKENIIRVQRRIYNGRLKIKQKVEVVKENKRSVWVRLPNGDVIKRRRGDIVNGQDADDKQGHTEARDKVA